MMSSGNKNTETMDKTSKKVTVKKNSKGKAISIIQFEDLEGKFLHVKVGNNERPATLEELEEFQNQLVDLFEKNNVNCLALVTHHAVSIDIIEKVN